MDAILANIMAFTANGSEGNIKNKEMTVAQRNTAPHKAISLLQMADVSLGVICFSKERPFQLHQFLCSLEVYCQPYADIVMVLYHPGAYSSLYDRVFSMHPNVQPVKEGDFHSDLLNCAATARTTATHIMFAVDDLIFVNRFNAK